MHYSDSMKRSISMPVKPRNDPPNTLKRSNETDKLNNDEDYDNDDDDDIDSNDTYNHYDNLPGTSHSTDDQKKFKFHTTRSSSANDARKQQNWYGSGTIEIQSNETLDNNIDTVDCRRKTDKKTTTTDYNSEKRLINQNGYQNVNFINVPERSVRYCKDMITTLIEQNWTYTLTLFTGSFFLSWFIFGCLWYLIGKAHGDLDFLNGKRMSDGKQPCVVGATTLMGMFIHSFEIQTTIGYGERYPTEECPEGVFLFVIQIIISIGFEGAMVSVVYAKLARPLTHISKLTFSKTACICQRDGKLCLVFRVCDPREQKSISTKIRVYVVLDVKTIEGETMKIHKELIIDNHGTGLIMWPETICHVIDRTSLFYKFTEHDFNTRNYEIFVSLVGHSPTTGLQTESRTSYLPQEINWSEQFVNVILYNRIKQNYIIDYDNFHTTVPIKFN